MKWIGLLALISAILVTYSQDCFFTTRDSAVTTTRSELALTAGLNRPERMAALTTAMSQIVHQNRAKFVPQLESSETNGIEATPTERSPEIRALDSATNDSDLVIAAESALDQIPTNDQDSRVFVLGYLLRIQSDRSRDRARELVAREITSVLSAGNPESDPHGSDDYLNSLTFFFMKTSNSSAITQIESWTFQHPGPRAEAMLQSVAALAPDEYQQIKDRHPAHEATESLAPINERTSD